MNNESMLPVGTMLRGGTYKITKQLSSGGFGNTYMVQNVNFNETYAMKEFFMHGINLREGDTVTVSVPDNKATFESQKAKLKKEAQRLRKLHNAHIVQVHDLFEERGTVYYVMDYIDGESLGSRLQRMGKPLTEAEAMDVLRQMLDALDLVHSQSPQLLHLDIKPANIMMDGSGCAYLIDFGASKQIATDDNNALSTTTGMSYTAGYAPSEQIEQNYERMGPWTDFYALGATLYKLVTLQQPPTPSDISDDGTDAFHFPATVSESCRKLICWMMTPSRKKRPQTVEAILDFLDKRGEVEKEAVKPSEKTLFTSGKPTADEKTRYGVFSQGNDETELQQQQYGKEEVPSSSFLRSLPWKWLSMIAVIAVIVVGVGVYWLMNHNKTTDSPVAALSADTAVKEEVTQEYMKLPEEQRNIIQNLIDNMVSVEGGTFTMGATAEQGSDAWDNEKPAHKVTLSSFSIGKYEVTQEEWEAVMGSNPSNSGAKHSVEEVSWDDCQEFIRKLNALTGKQFRLPTEAEWEYAARGGDRSRGYKYSGSDNIGSVAWSRDNSEFTTHPVGQNQANELGLYDMSGNVWEWCQDWYGENYYGSSPSQNPKGPSTGSFRVIRGGCWGNDEESCRVSIRGSAAPDDRYSAQGLRLAL